tara:strand:+ start:504 stop:743 length:240 start_codon:yes stop_codon:yes gene_type:complete
MKEIKIEKNIPLTKRKEGKLERVISKMEIGDSFFLENGDGTGRGMRYAFIKLYGKKSYASRYRYGKEGNKIGVRYWRLR